MQQQKKSLGSNGGGNSYEKSQYQLTVPDTRNGGKKNPSPINFQE